MSEELQRLDQALTVQWPGVGAVPIHTANQFLAQIDVAGEHPDQLIIAIGQVTPPAVLGTPEQKRAQLDEIDEIDEIDVNTLARYSITLALLRELIGLLQQVEHVLEGGKAQGEGPETPTARRQWLRMAERARQRMASAPTYPDHPDDLAEQEAVTRAFAARQARAQSES